MYREKGCRDLIERKYISRIEALRNLYSSYLRGEEYCEEECSSLYEYGLSLDYVPPYTFIDQKEAYIRYQLSWGGPADEFRFFINPDYSIHRIEYWYLDWFDGANIILDGEDFELMESILSNLVAGDIRYLIEKE